MNLAVLDARIAPRRIRLRPSPQPDAELLLDGRLELGAIEFVDDFFDGHARPETFDRIGPALRDSRIGGIDLRHALRREEPGNDRELVRVGLQPCLSELFQVEVRHAVLVSPVRLRGPYATPVPGAISSDSISD